MTLIVSEVSRHGIVMVGDRATRYQCGEHIETKDVASKVFYSKTLNMGFSCWGNASFNGKQMDFWMENFINSQIRPNDTMKQVALNLEQQLQKELSETKKPWEELVFGIHVAGYMDNFPRLWHIHCGHHGEPPHEPRLHFDFPEDTDHTSLDILERDMKNAANPLSFHLRNGKLGLFAHLFNSMKNYMASLKQNEGIDFPYNSLEGHLEFYRLLVEFIANMLSATKQKRLISKETTFIAFDKNGLVAKKLLPPQDWGFPEAQDSSASAAYSF